MVCESVRECSGVDARCWVDHESGRFVDDYERIVFVNDLDWYCFGSEAGCRGCCEFDFELVVFTQFVRRLVRFAVDENVLSFGHAVQSRAAPANDSRCEKGVQS